MPKAYFVVRAVVPDESRHAAFDHWYSTDHLPQAIAAFGAEKAWRFWSATDAAAHYAVYRFADRDRIARAVGGDAMKALVADFDRTWPGIARTREILTMAEEVDG